MSLQDPNNPINGIEQLTVFQGTMYFKCTVSSVPARLCSSDGTSILYLEAQSTSLGSISYIYASSTTLFFAAVPSGATVLLTTTDVVSFSQFDIVTNPSLSAPRELVGSLFIPGGRAGVGAELFRYTDGNVTLAGDLRPGTGNSNPSYLTVVGNTLFFSASGVSPSGFGLWRVVSGVSVNGKWLTVVVVSCGHEF